MFAALTCEGGKLITFHKVFINDQLCKGLEKMIPVPVSVQTTSTEFGCVIKNAAYAQSGPRPCGVLPQLQRHRPDASSHGTRHWKLASFLQRRGESQLRSIPQLPHLTLLFSWTTGPHNTAAHSFSGFPLNPPPPETATVPVAQSECK